MEKNWVILTESFDLFEIDVYKALLEENEIPCIIMDNQDSMNKFLNNTTSIKLYVNRNDIMRANQLIEQRESE